MNAMLISDKERVALGRLKAYAENNKIGVDELLDIFNGAAKPVGDRKGFECLIPVGYRVVFCIEFQKKGWARHMSVSLNVHGKRKTPHPEAIKQIMLYLGFEGEMNGKDVMVYFEDHDTVVNVIEYIK